MLYNDLMDPKAQQETRSGDTQRYDSKDPDEVTRL